MFDITQEITLNPKNYRKYRYFQIAIYSIAVFLAFYLGYLIAFPAKYFVFYPSTPGSAKSNVVNSKTEEGKIDSNGSNKIEINNIFFDTVLPGSYSVAKIDMTLGAKSPTPQFANIQIKKSYQAFFYPEGDPMRLSDGTLVRSQDNYFIVSREKLRRFKDVDILTTMGYKKEAFQEAGDNDLNYNEKGDDITSPTNYPDGSIFKANDEYYILKDQKLEKFVSAKAYLTRYDDIQAIEKTTDFLKNYALNENMVGFADGTLVSYGISAYIISGDKIMPIDNPNTFLSKGYQWSDIIAVSGDELSLYQRDKLFNISSPHPSGTIIENEAKNEMFLVKDGKKMPLPSLLIARSWSKNNHIAISQESTVPIGLCQMQKSFWNSRKLTCLINIENSATLIGTDYEFKVTADKGVKFDAVNITFGKTANKNNLKLAVLNLIYKIKGNYVPQTPTAGQ